MIDFLFEAPWRGYVQHLLIILCAIFAIWRGAGPEKGAAGTMLGMVLLDYLYHFVFPRGQVYHTVNLGHLVIDAIVLVCLGVIALRANRMYPLWMLGAQLVSVLAHFTREIAPEMWPTAYLILTRIPSWFQLFVLIGGLALHERRIARYGMYRSWRRF